MQNEWKWVISQALYECRMFLMVSLLIFFTSMGEPKVPASLGIIALVVGFAVTIPQILYYREMYRVSRITSKRLGITVEVGHRDAFRARWLLDQTLPEGVERQQHTPMSWTSTDAAGKGWVHMTPSEGYLYKKGAVVFKQCLAYRNGLVIVAEDERDIQRVRQVLMEEWPLFALLGRRDYDTVRICFDGTLSYNVGGNLSN